MTKWQQDIRASDFSCSCGAKFRSVWQPDAYDDGRMPSCPQNTGEHVVTELRAYDTVEAFDAARPEFWRQHAPKRKRTVTS